MAFDDETPGGGDKNLSLGALGLAEEQDDAIISSGAQRGKRRRQDGESEGGGNPNDPYKLGSEAELQNKFVGRLGLIFFFLFFIGSVIYYYADTSDGGSGEGLRKRDYYNAEQDGPHRFHPAWYDR